ncbi:MAG: hypothetical protein CH6_0667 [Candidatus Kapaibacterium sp.]|jgi:hypothetical protein|nr:MAG: hypothetical protein CH6_0667 [Candidatus Kapabacteria bacterium]ROL56110.1 MAG: hypothetical protein D9V84_09300 [Bacteroidetes/Chlorobi group bacterium Naka2016]
MKKIALLFALLLLFASNSCKEEETNVPSAFANISAVISGAINLEYSGAGLVTTATLDSSLVLNLGTSTRINNKLCMLGVFIFFRDFQEKTGTFQFANRNDVIPGDFAIGTFDYGEGNSRKQFISDSGWVEITKLEGNTVRGTFYFRAKEKTTGEVIEVQNGVIVF